MLPHKASSIPTWTSCPRALQKSPISLASGDMEVVMDALLSLRITSSMAGAHRLERYCRQLEHQPRYSPWPDSETVRTALSTHAGMILVEGRRPC